MSTEPFRDTSFYANYPSPQYYLTQRYFEDCADNKTKANPDHVKQIANDILKTFQKYDDNLKLPYLDVIVDAALTLPKDQSLRIKRQKDPKQCHVTLLGEKLPTMTTNIHSVGNDIHLFVKVSNVKSIGRTSKFYHVGHIAFKNIRNMQDSSAKPQYELALRGKLSCKISDKKKDSLCCFRIKMMEDLNGTPHIINLISWAGYISKPSTTNTMMKINLFTDLYGGDFLEFINRGNCSFGFKRKNLKKFSLGSAKALVELHKKYVHRDVKPENVLLSFEVVNGNWKIRDIVYTDFDLSCLKTDKESLKIPRGSLPFLPPELISRTSQALLENGTVLSNKNFEEEIDERSDMWGVGLMLFCLYYEKNPIIVEKLSEYSRIFLTKQKLRNNQNSKEASSAEASSAIKKLQNEEKEVLAAIKQALFDLQQIKAPLREDTYDYIIWRLLRPIPKERLSSQELLERLEAYYSRKKKQDK